MTQEHKSHPNCYDAT